MEILFDIIGFYLVFIGTYRLANSTRQKPGGDFSAVADEDDKYDPFADLKNPSEAFRWMKNTFTNRKEPGKFYDAVVLHKKFNWGLLFLLFGIFIQFIGNLLSVII